ncbi:MAG: transposase [Bacteroidetes bacterium]|nr:transposase [Bacteroidota bacterium]
MENNSAGIVRQCVISEPTPVVLSVGGDGLACAEWQGVQSKGIETYITPERLDHGEWYRIGVVRGRKPKGMGVKELMRRKLRTKKGKKAYSKRKETVEPVFGQIKQVRGFRQFLLRGLEKVRAEWRLICLTHNLLKLFRYG